MFATLILASAISLSACGATSSTSEETVSSESAAVENSSANDHSSESSSMEVEAEKAPELTDEEQEAVGTYIGSLGSFISVLDDKSAAYYYIGYDEPYTDCSWKYDGTTFSITIDDLDVTMRGDLPTTDKEATLVGNRDDWSDEIFKKIDSNSEILNADQYVDLRKNTIEVPDKDEMKGFNSASNVSYTVNGHTFELPSYYGDSRVSSDDKSMFFYIADGSPYTYLMVVYAPDCNKNVDWGKNGQPAMTGALNGLYENSSSHNCWLVDYQLSKTFGTYLHAQFDAEMSLSQDKQVYDYNVKSVLLYNEAEDTMYEFLLMEAADSEYGYSDDLDRIVSSFAETSASDSSKSEASDEKQQSKQQSTQKETAAAEKESKKDTAYKSDKSGSNASYQEILDSYTKKLQDATPGLIKEYQNEAKANTNGVDGLAEICNDKISVLAEICDDGISEMAEIYFRSGSGAYSEYEDWAGKLTDVYMEESGKITDVYINSAS